MSAAAMGLLAGPGPIELMGRALKVRLQTVFTPAYFDFSFMPQRATREWYSRSFKRTPGIALGWNGIQATRDDGGVFTGRAHWTVALFVENKSGVEPRLFGDALMPGLFQLQRLATLLLHGFQIDCPDAGWAASGPVIVNAVGNLYNDEWGNADMAIVGLDLSILYEESLPNGLEPEPSAGSLVDAITWQFGDGATALTQTISTGEA